MFKRQIYVRVFNYGDSAQTILPYNIRINNGAVQSGTLELDPPLAKNQSRQVILNETLDLSQPGNLNVKVWAVLPGDTGIYSVNDTPAIRPTLFAITPTPAPPINTST